jgi:N-succinyldiaminopimelate aminotransferase
VNPLLDRLQPYPFEKLRALFASVDAPAGVKPISFGIGEPKHPTPQFIRDALSASLGGLASYPATAGTDALRQAIAAWLTARYKLPHVDPVANVLPVAGSREALFSFAQTVINSSPYRDSSNSGNSDTGAAGRGPHDATAGGADTPLAPRPAPTVLCPNPFYQIYEGAALLAGAEPYYVNSDPARNFACDYSTVPADIWARAQLLYVCSPGNPAGAVLTLDDWREIFELSERYGFTVAADECYSEIYLDETKPPLGVLEAAHRLGRGMDRIVMFSSLSKRSNVPGMRSGFVAGDPAILRKFLLYRTYHGTALSPVMQSASVAAWQDENHVRINRSKYVKKFQTITPLLAEVLDVAMPDAGFYLWARVDRLGIDDTEFARRLFAEYNVTVLPGSYLARDTATGNPGRNFVRIALVAELEECLEGVQRIVEFCRALQASPAPAAPVASAA